jgi:hypothetical protein
MGPQLRSKTATVGRSESAIDRCSEATSERHSEAVMARAELGAKAGERGTVEPWLETAIAGRSELVTDWCSEVGPERRSEAVAARVELGAKVGERGPETMADVGWIGNWCSGQDYWGSTHSFCFDGLQDGEGTLVI